MHLLRDEYRIREVSKVEADTLEELASRMDGVDEAGFLSTVRAFNAAVREEVPFDPTVRDGRGTNGLTSEDQLGEPARRAAVRRLRHHLRDHLHLRRPAHRRARRRARRRAVPDPRAVRRRGAGRGLFFFNIGGTGLMSGAVFGRIAGTSAGALATS